MTVDAAYAEIVELHEQHEDLQITRSSMNTGIKEILEQLANDSYENGKAAGSDMPVDFIPDFSLYDSVDGDYNTDFDLLDEENADNEQ